MKLYVNDNGLWVGTQAEAKKIGAKQYEVPTDKPSLIKFLNSEDCKIKSKVVETPPVKSHPQSCSANPNVYDVKDAVLNCDFENLGQAISSIMTRLHDEHYQININKDMVA